MSKLKDLFQNNRRWAAGKITQDPNFFKKLVRVQRPKFLWIGCSDSRVPANDIVGLLPGELFVHRNVGNVVVHTDLNCLSVIQFAVDVLKVSDIIVCGHYGCGGVSAALKKSKLGLIDNWLRHIQDVATKYDHVLSKIKDQKKKSDKLCEFNVIEQVSHVAQTTIIQDALERKQNVAIHGWVYSLEDGLLNELDVVQGRLTK